MSEVINTLSADDCPTTEISAYLDAELSPAAEIEIELHLAACHGCTDELNIQKQFLCSLNSTMADDGLIELPKDFTRKIVINAESGVSGLRRPNERFSAIFVCSALLIFIMFALGSEASGLLSGIGDSLEQAAVVGGFVGRLIYSFVYAISSVFRTIGGHIQIPFIGSFLFIGCVALTAFYYQRLSGRIRRA